jgi:hypothetical protein
VPIQFVAVAIGAGSPGLSRPCGDHSRGRSILLGADVDTAALTRTIDALSRHDRAGGSEIAKPYSVYP